MDRDRPTASGPEIVVVRTGTANLASVCAALTRAGVRPRCSEDPRVVRDADLVVLPGVGAFGATIDELRRTGLDAAITKRIARSRPLLAICLGLQVLCESSEESPGIQGLRVIPVRVTRFRRDSSVRVPHFGWNTVVPSGASAVVQRGRAYFAHSYKLDSIPDGWSGSMSNHGDEFVAALERGGGAVVACQFHPELSGIWGASFIERWINKSISNRSGKCLHSV